jgi:hypothetical protein
MTDTEDMPEAETSHADAETHDSGHGHEGAAEPLGPLDLTTWAYALAGGTLGVVVVIALIIANAD